MDFDFKYSNSYTGIWYIPNSQNDIKIYGTLSLDKQSMTIDFVTSGINNDYLGINIPRMDGIVFSTDEKGKECTYTLSLRNLLFLKKNPFYIDCNHFLYDVKTLIIYKGKVDFGKIKSVCFYTKMLNKWASHQIKDCFKDSKLFEGKISFSCPQPIVLFENSEIELSLFIGHKSFFDNETVGINVKPFFTLNFKSPVEFGKAQFEINKYSQLLFLLWNNNYEFDFVEYRTEEGRFTCKTSEKHLFRYMSTYKNASPFTELSDILNEKLSFEIIKKWTNLYEEYKVAIITFIETTLNSISSPSMKIKNYISALDAFSKDMKGEEKEIDKNSKKSRTIYGILGKVDKIISRDEINKLKTWTLIEKGTALKPRLKKMISELDELLSDSGIDNTFIEKIVNTRNNFTHPKEYEENSFKYSELDDAAYLLTKIIRAFLLRKIGLDKNLIKRIIKF